MHPYGLQYFDDSTTKLIKGENLRDSDKQRFFQVYSQDSGTTVALIHLEIKYKADNPTTGDFIKRSSKKAGHAEAQAIEEINSILKTNEQKKVESVDIVMNITYSPCIGSECLQKLYIFFSQMSERSKFHLRLAYLHHEKGEKGATKPVERLASWLIAMDDVPQCEVKLDAIQVAQELKDYSFRDQSKWKSALDTRKKMDEEMLLIIQKIYEKKEELKKEMQQELKKKMQQPEVATDKSVEEMIKAMKELRLK